MFNTGLVSVSFRDKSPEEIMHVCREAGLTNIEWGSDVHAPKNDTNKLSEIAKLQIEYGISCCSYGTYFRLGVTPLDALREYISAAKVLGTNILRVWCSDKGSANFDAQSKEVFFEECKKAAQIAVENDVVLCMECHHGTFTDTAESSLELMRAVNSPNFRMYWQPNQFMSFEENKRFSEEISRYTKHIHVFNWDKDNKYPLINGKNEWKSYLDSFSGEHYLLLEFMPDGKIESFGAEADALREIIKGCECE